MFEFSWRTTKRRRRVGTHTILPHHLAVGLGLKAAEARCRVHFKRADAGPLLKFMRKFDAGRGLIISDGVEASWPSAEGTIEVVPYWKYWSLHKMLAEWEVA